MQIHSEPSVGILVEADRNDTPMEWWFVQGHYEGKATSQREFMAALFRYHYKLPWSTAVAGNAFSLILTVLDPASGRTTLLSQVDPATCQLLVTLGRLAPPAGIDPILIRAVADEIAENGPPRPIHTELAPVAWKTTPFRAIWNGFELAQLMEAFELRFAEPATKRQVRLQLTPTHPRIHLSDIAVIGAEAMDYISYPRLRLSGTVDGAPVNGQAWLDHQWGSHGWLAAGLQLEQILGWDWLGIQLDNDRDLLVMVHRDQRHGTCLCQYAVLVGATPPAQLIREFTLTPTAWWTSPATRARYPIGWRLLVPELELVLEFTPCAKEQEIPTLPPVRAVWEGAGHVTGTWAGKPVAGRARLELHGYAYLRDLREQLHGVVQRIGCQLEDYLPRQFSEATMERYAGASRGQYDPAAQTFMLATPLWDLFDRGGEHWEPIFALLLLEALGVMPEPYELLFCFTGEMLVGGAQVIDDIEDNACIRRGAECLHLRYGLDVAINAANTAYFLPMTLLRDYQPLTDTQRLELYKIMSRVYVREHLGQGQDLYRSRFLTQDWLRESANDSLGSKILQLYSLKTGTLVEGAAEAACVIANCDKATRSVCCELGHSFGVALQITDDLVDFSPMRLRRGDAGCDLTEGKLTYVIFRALERLPEPQRSRLGTILCTPALRQQPAVRAEGVELVGNSGALAVCRQEAYSMVGKQWLQLSAHLPASEAKTMLRVFCHFILSQGDNERDLDFVPGK